MLKRNFSIILILVLVCLAALPVAPREPVKVRPFKREPSSKALMISGEPAGIGPDRGGEGRPVGQGLRLGLYAFFPFRDGPDAAAAAATPAMIAAPMMIASSRKAEL